MSAGAVVKRIGISIGATIVGCVAGAVMTALVSSVHVLSSPDSAQAAAAGGVIGAILYVPWIMLPIWLVVLLPLHLTLPASAARPRRMAAVGAAVGVLLVEILFGLPSSHQVSIGPYIVAAVVGSATLYTGTSMLRDQHLTRRCS